MGTAWLGRRGGKRSGGRPPTAGAYGRRAVRGPRRLGPIPDAPAERGEGRQTGTGGGGGGARGSVSSDRRAAGSRHGGGCRRPPHSRAPPPRPPASVAASAAPPLARPLCAPSPGGPARLGPRRLCEAPPRGPPARPPARSRALVLIASSQPCGRRESDPELPHASAPFTVPNLSLRPTPPKIYIVKRS